MGFDNWDRFKKKGKRNSAIAMIIGAILTLGGAIGFVWGIVRLLVALIELF